MSAKTAVKLKTRTEAEMLAMLRRRLERDAGNGPTNVLVTHVKDAAGHAARRTIDAFSMGLWPSRGLMIDAYEVKCSRSDWLRELKDPEKADGFCERVDRFWLVAANTAIVKPGELPEAWGLLVAHGNQLREQVAAPLLRGEKVTKTTALPPAIDRSFLAALLRASSKGGGQVPAEYLEEIRVEERETAKRLQAFETDRMTAQVKELEALIERFDEAAGVHLGAWPRGERAAQIGAAVRRVLDVTDQTDRLRQQLVRDAERYREFADLSERAAEGLATAAGGSSR